MAFREFREMFLVAAVSVTALVLAVDSQHHGYPQHASSRHSYGGEFGGYDGRHGTRDTGGGGGIGGGGGGGRGYGSGSGVPDGNYQTENKYYYGGEYQGACSTDGLYYFDDTMFVVCSNGYPHEQPCPPGTKTSGSPKYQAGYYYGYTDLCSVNLVDYGYGPEYYAPKGYPVSGDGYGDKGTGYGAYDKANVKDTYPSKRREHAASSYEPRVSEHKDNSRSDHRTPYSDTKSAYPQPNAHSPKHKDSYSRERGPYGANTEKKHR